MIAVLCAMLVLWRPLDFAFEVLMTFPSLRMRGWLGVIELVWHGAVAVMAVAAARALWSESQAGPQLAVVALIASAAASVQSNYWSVLPHQTLPGDERILVTISIVNTAFWLVYLSRRRRA